VQRRLGAPDSGANWPYNLPIRKGDLTVKQFLQQLRADQEGATAIEYALIAALIAVGLLVVLGDVGTAIQAVFQSIADALSA